MALHDADALHLLLDELRPVAERFLERERSRIQRPGPPEPVRDAGADDHGDRGREQRLDEREHDHAAHEHRDGLDRSTATGRVPSRAPSRPSTRAPSADPRPSGRGTRTTATGSARTGGGAGRSRSAPGPWWPGTCGSRRRRRARRRGRAAAPTKKPRRSRWPSTTTRVDGLPRDERCREHHRPGRRMRPRARRAACGGGPRWPSTRAADRSSCGRGSSAASSRCCGRHRGPLRRSNLPDAGVSLEAGFSAACLTPDIRISNIRDTAELAPGGRPSCASSSPERPA